MLRSVSRTINVCFCVSIYISIKHNKAHSEEMEEKIIEKNNKIESEEE